MSMISGAGGAGGAAGAVALVRLDVELLEELGLLAGHALARHPGQRRRVPNVVAEVLPVAVRAIRHALHLAQSSLWQVTTPCCAAAPLLVSTRKTTHTCPSTTAEKLEQPVPNIPKRADHRYPGY